MLQRNTDSRRELPAPRDANGGSGVDALLAQLRSHGLRTQDAVAARGDSLCGVTLTAPAPAANGELTQMTSRLVDAQCERIPVTIDVTARTSDPDDYEDFCRYLRQAGLRKSSAINVFAARLPISLRAYALISRNYLGDGRRYLKLEDWHRDDGEAERWHYLWRHAGGPWAVIPVYAGLVRSSCPLLSDEVADSVYPANGLCAPNGSAWLPMRLNLADFADAGGQLRLRDLERALVAAVRTGDRLIDRLRWPSAPMLDDARNNRRMALLLDGIGDLARLQGRDPAELVVLNDMSGLVRHVKATLSAASLELAADNELLPAIARNCPSRHTQGSDRHATWSAHWHEAVRRCAVRHRNLLLLSPVSVIPCQAQDRRSWSDLLPLLAYADACACLPERVPHDWKLLDYKRFHHRAAAEINRWNEPSVIATRA